jgi:hypothetical protein
MVILKIPLTVGVPVIFPERVSKNKLLGKGNCVDVNLTALLLAVN